MNKNRPSVYLKTFGCQMNVRDSEFVAGLLMDAGFRLARDEEDADVVVFNSCSVRKHAEDKLFSNIGGLGKLKKRKPGLVIGLMGCVAQSLKDKAIDREPLLDFVCGTGNLCEMPEIVKGILADRCRAIAADKVNDKRPEALPSYRSDSFKANVLIGEGCNNFCSYCIVPYVRGRERYREARDVIREVKSLAERGFKEITLLGQNVNSYGNYKGGYKGVDKGQGEGRGLGFIGLLEKLNKIDGIERIRFMTSHPKDASADLFRAMRDLEKVCAHLHLPLQSGSDRILKLMNRKYTISRYMKLVTEYKKILPEGSITSDFVVGFPSETDKDFRDTIGAMRRAEFDSAYTFKYSPRPPAKSSELRDNVTDAVKEKRLKTIMDIQCKISEENNSRLVGRTMEVMVDGLGKGGPGRLRGRTRTNKVVVFDGNGSLTGRTVSVLIESAAPYALKGKIVK